MRFKENSQEPKKVIKMTQKEHRFYLNLCSVEPPHPIGLAWMKKNNIEFNQGYVNVEIDGETYQMRTEKGDNFGLIRKPEWQKEGEQSFAE